MATSEYSTLLSTGGVLGGDQDTSFQLLDGHAYGTAGLDVHSSHKSPYTGCSIISLDVGPNQIRFLVHRTLLSQSRELDVKLPSKLWGEKNSERIVLPDLDESTAHTLVHYLYSGKYQTLPRENDITKQDSEAVAGYKLGTCVYCAAIRYKLPGLAELAREKISSMGEELSVMDVLKIAREDAFPGLPEDESWFPAYLENVIVAAHAEDNDIFQKPAFSDQIEGNRRFRQVVLKAITNSYLKQAASAGARQASASAPGMGSRVEETTAVEASDTAQLDGPTEPLTNELDNGMSEMGEEVLTSNAVPAPAESNVGHKRVDSVIQTPEIPEPATDELNWGNSKIYKQLGSKPDKSSLPEPKTPVVDETPVAVPEPEPSVPNEVPPLVAEPEKVVEESPVSVAEPETVIEETPVSMTKPEIVIEETPVSVTEPGVETVLPPQTEIIPTTTPSTEGAINGDVSGPTTKKNKKKKKKNKAAVTAA